MRKKHKEMIGKMRGAAYFCEADIREPEFKLKLMHDILLKSADYFEKLLEEGDADDDDLR